VIYAKAIEG